MKELIGSVILIAGLLGAGSMAAREIHDVIRKAALEKSAQGLPSLTSLTAALRAPQK